MTFFGQLSTAFLCVLFLSVILQHVQGLPKPKSSIRTSDEKKVHKRAKLMQASVGATCKLRCRLISKLSKVEWFLNRKLLNHTHETSKNYRLKRHHRMEVLVIPKVTVNDGGTYACLVEGNKMVSWRILIVKTDKKKSCRKKRSVDKKDICKTPLKGGDPLHCTHLNYTKCKSFAGVPKEIQVVGYIYQSKPAIQIGWRESIDGNSDLLGFEVTMLGYAGDANHYECLQLPRKNTYWTFQDKIVYGAEYILKLRSLPSNTFHNERIRLKEKCQYKEFMNEQLCCSIMNLNSTILAEEGKIHLSWNVNCPDNTTGLKRFLVFWTNLQLQPKCYGDFNFTQERMSETSRWNYTIDLESECQRYNYSIQVYGIFGKEEQTEKGAKIIVSFPEKKISPPNPGPRRKNVNMKIVVSVVGVMIGLALVALFFIYKFFFTKVTIKLPSCRYEPQEGAEGTPLHDRPKRVLIMHARCCEKCNWVIHCLGKLLNSTNLVDARSDVWHMQDIASGVMRWYEMEVRDADCVLVLASNKMKVLNEDVHTPNKDVNDLLPIRAQLNLVAGEMTKEPNTPKFISAYFAYSGQATDVPTLLNSRLTHKLTKDLDRLIFHVLNIEAIQPYRTQPIAVIGGTEEFDSKKDDLVLAVSQAKDHHAPQDNNNFRAAIET